MPKTKTDELCPKVRLECLESAWRAERKVAENRYGPFASTHEGYGVLAEEMAELLDAIRANDKQAIIHEAVQVSAVAFRIATSLEHAATAARSKP